MNSSTFTLLKSRTFCFMYDLNLIQADVYINLKGSYMFLHLLSLRS